MLKGIRQFNSPAMRYGFAIALAAEAILLRYAMTPLLGIGYQYVTVYPAIIVVATFAGLGPAILTSILGSLMAEYYFSPGLAFADIPVISIVIFTGALAGWLAQRLSDALAQSQERSDALARQTAVQEAVSRILKQALSCKTEEELGRDCLIVAEEITQSKAGFMGIINEQGRLDDIAISDPGWVACRAMIGEGHSGYRTVPTGFEVHAIYGRVLLDAKGFFTNDPPSHPDSIGVPEGHPALTSFLGVPLIEGDKVIGMVGLANRSGGYSREHLDAMETLAVAIAQGYLRFKAEEAQRESKERFHGTFENAAVGITLLDPNGKWIDVNQKFCEMLGYSREAMIGTEFAVLTYPDDIEADRQQYKQLVEGRIWRHFIEKRYVRKDGRIVWVELYRTLQRDVKRPAHIFNIGCY